MSRNASRFEGRYPAPSGGQQTFRYETLALIARMTTPPGAAHARAIDGLLSALIVSGAYAAMDAFYVMAAQDEQAAKLNWIADAYNLTETGSVTFEAFKGYTATTTSTYLSTGFNPTTAVSPKFTQDDAHLGGWHLTNNLNGGAASFDLGAGSNVRMIKVANGNISYRPNNATSEEYAGSFASHKMYVRTASNAWQFYYAGAEVDSGADASAALSNFDMSIGRTAVGALGVNQAAIVHFGSQLSAAQALAVYGACLQYGRAVGMV